MYVKITISLLLIGAFFICCSKSSEKQAQPAEESTSAAVEQATAADTVTQAGAEAAEKTEVMAETEEVMKKQEEKPIAKVQVKEPVKLEQQALVPLDIKLPAPVFTGTPQNMNVPNLEKPLGKARPPFLAPAGTKNLVAGKAIASSDDMPIIGSLDLITDGDKEATDGSYVELGPFVQNITVDIGQKSNIYAVVVWHFHKQPRVYFDVIVQVADDPDFTTNVKTLFNNDIDNSAGLGTGKDMHYVETSEGKLIDAKGIQARYLRCYSNGNNNNDLNHYIELEVYGIPVE
jgi:hypothetical protein